MARNISHLEELQHLESYSIANYCQNKDIKNGNFANNKADEKDRKNYEKKIIDLTKTNRQLSADVEMWRRKCSIVQEKYHNINMRMAKDKFIGRPR